MVCVCVWWGDRLLICRMARFKLDPRLLSAAVWVCFELVPRGSRVVGDLDVSVTS